MAEQSLDNDAVDTRDFVSITMAIDVDKIPEAKRRIREFWSELRQFLEFGSKKEVYQFSAQLFPLSRVQSKTV